MEPLGVVVAMARGGVIGRAGGLPWERIPEDLKHFKEITLGHPVIMGRKTQQSIGRLLPGRDNIVITLNPPVLLPGSFGVGDFLSAVKKARELNPAVMPMVIGGAQVYGEAMGHATHLFLTEIDQDVVGDRHFDFKRESWTEQPGTRRMLAPRVAFAEYRRRT